MFTPEVNYTSMVSGAGPAPMLAYGDVLTAHHASMTAVAGASASSATATFGSWSGQGSTVAQAALVAHNTEHLLLAEETLAKAEIAHMAAVTHTSTVTRMVPAPHAIANRMEEAADQQTQNGTDCSLSVNDYLSRDCIEADPCYLCYWRER